MAVPRIRLTVLACRVVYETRAFAVSVTDALATFQTDVVKLEQQVGEEFCAFASHELDV